MGWFQNDKLHGYGSTILPYDARTDIYNYEGYNDRRIIGFYEEDKIYTVELDYLCSFHE